MDPERALGERRGISAHRGVGCVGFPENRAVWDAAVRSVGAGGRVWTRAVAPVTLILHDDSHREDESRDGESRADANDHSKC